MHENIKNVKKKKKEDIISLRTYILQYQMKWIDL